MRSWFWCVALLFAAGSFPCRGVACIAQATTESSPAGESLEACMRETETASQARKAACAELEQLGVAVDAVLVKNAGVPPTDASQAGAWFAKFEELRKQLPAVQGSRAGDLAGTVYLHNLDLVRGFDRCAQWASASAAAASDAALRGLWTAQKAVFQTQAERYRTSAVDALAAQRKFRDLAAAAPQVAEATVTAAAQVQFFLAGKGGEAGVDWKAYHLIADHAAAIAARTLSEFVLAARTAIGGRTGEKKSVPFLPSEGAAAVVAGLPTPAPGKAGGQRVTRERVSMMERVAAKWLGNWEGEWEETFPNSRLTRRFVLIITSVSPSSSSEICIEGVVHGEDGKSASLTGKIRKVDPIGPNNSFYEFAIQRRYEGHGNVLDHGALHRSGNSPDFFAEVVGTWRTGNRSGTWRMWPVK